MEDKQLKNVIIYDSWFELFDKLTEEQVGKFMMGISRWRKGEPLTCDDPLVLGILWNAEKQLQDMRTNYQKKVETNRENGKKGGRPKKKSNPTVTQDNPKNPMGYSKTQPNPQNLKEKEKEKEKDREIEKDKTITITGKEVTRDEKRRVKEFRECKSALFDELVKSIENENLQEY